MRSRRRRCAPRRTTSRGSASRWRIELDGAVAGVADLDGEGFALAWRIAGALRDAERPLVVVGPTLGSAAVIDAAANVARALCAAGRPARLCAVAPMANSFGLALLEPRPLDAAFARADAGAVGAAIVLEADLFRAAPRAAVERFLVAAERVIALDAVRTGVTDAAGVALPAGAVEESGGTFVNHEVRAQRFFQVYVPDEPVRASWRWLLDLAPAFGRDAVARWTGLDDVIDALVADEPALAPVREIAPPERFRMPGGQRVARQPQRYSGRTAMRANREIQEPAAPADVDAPMVFSMEGSAQWPPSLTPRYWAPGWNSVQALNKFQEEIGGPLRGGDPGRRLVEPRRIESSAYRGEPPAAFAARDGEWLVVPLPHIFGSGELSSRGPAIRALTPAPYAGVGDADARALGIDDRVRVAVRVGEQAWELPVRRIAGLPRGVIGLRGRPARHGRTGRPARMGDATRARRGGAGGRPVIGDVVKPLVIVLIVLGGTLQVAAFLIWVERRLLGLWQDRYGPNRVGPFGLLQPLADAIKLFAKEDWVPPFADPVVFIARAGDRRRDVAARLRPDPDGHRHPGCRPEHRAAVLPRDVVARRLQRRARRVGVEQQVLADRWAAVGRADAVVRGFHGPLADGRGDPRGVVLVRADRRGAGGIWYCIPQFVGLVVFMTAGLAEARRLPFDLPEAESELVGGLPLRVFRR